MSRSRAAGPGGTAIAGSLLDSIPLASRRPLSLGSRGLAGPEAGETGWEGVRRGGAAEGKKRGWEPAGKSAHPLALAPASAVRLGSPSTSGSALLPGVEDRDGF